MTEAKQIRNYDFMCVRCGYKANIAATTPEQAIMSGFQLHDLRQRSKEFRCLTPLRKYYIKHTEDKPL